MGVNKELGREARKRPRPQASHLPGKSLSSPSCGEPTKEEVDSLLQCERHVLEAKLEGQIGCWDEMLFHIDLWSREASRQKRTRIVELLDAERAEARAAMERAYEDLGTLRGERTPASATPGRAESPRRDSLPLPPGAARPPFPGLGRLRRR